jgi:hypothetical protein
MSYADARYSRATRINQKLVLSEQRTTIPRIVEQQWDYEYNLNLCVTTPNTKQEPIAGS